MPLNAPIMKISACRKHQASVHVNGADLIEVRVSNHCFLLLVKKNLIKYVLAIKSDNKKIPLCVQKIKPQVLVSVVYNNNIRAAELVFCHKTLLYFVHLHVCNL